MERCNHPSGVQCVDAVVPPEIEAGAKAFYQSSINLSYPGGWQWLSPHVRNRWRWRFQNALDIYHAAQLQEKFKAFEQNTKQEDQLCLSK